MFLDKSLKLLEVSSHVINAQKKLLLERFLEIFLILFYFSTMREEVHPRFVAVSPNTAFILRSPNPHFTAFLTSVLDCYLSTTNLVCSSPFSLEIIFFCQFPFIQQCNLSFSHSFIHLAFLHSNVYQEEIHWQEIQQ